MPLSMAPDQNRTPLTLEDVPNEVMIKIVSLIAGGPSHHPVNRKCIPDLKALSLANSRFLPACREYIFQQISLSIAFDPNDDRVCHDNSIRVLEQSPYLAVHVRSLSISAKKKGVPRGNDNVDAETWRLNEMERYFALIKNMRWLSIYPLTIKYLPQSTRLTNALRSLVFSNLQIEFLLIGDTVFFPMDVIFGAPKLVTLIIAERREQKHITQVLNRSSLPVEGLLYIACTIKCEKAGCDHRHPSQYTYDAWWSMMVSVPTIHSDQ